MIGLFSVNGSTGSVWLGQVKGHELVGVVSWVGLEFDKLFGLGWWFEFVEGWEDIMFC